MAQDRAEIEQALGQAAIRLTERGFLQRGNILSQRIPEQEAFVWLRIAGDGGVMKFRWTGLFARHIKPLQDIYTARPDVGAVAFGALPWTSALWQMGLSLPAVFDEQVRHLGIEVARLPTGTSTSIHASTAFANGANAYVTSRGALCFGMNLDRLIANIEILEKCSQSYVLAHATGRRPKRIPWIVRYIANKRLKKDQHQAATRHRAGQRSIAASGY